MLDVKVKKIYFVLGSGVQLFGIVVIDILLMQGIDYGFGGTLVARSTDLVLATRISFPRVFV